MGNKRSIKEEKEYKVGIVISELRNELLLALRYARGENTNLIRLEKRIRSGLSELEELEGLVT